ncbi:MAG: DNA-binding protein [Thermomicrobiales bacterium]|nr:MAG: DNA-binding protein [Thermomicrobiales bacterium]
MSQERGGKKPPERTTSLSIARERDRSRWLSIQEACEYLGVDQSTLRRWSDAGKVPVFRTPGGHRRYAIDDLLALVGEGPRRQERHRVGRQELTDRTLAAYEEAYLRAARERRWYQAYNAAGHEELRRQGRRLVDVAVRYASSPASSDRAALLAEGQQIGEYYGRSGAQAGLSAVETVEAFLYFRFPVIRAMLGMLEEEGAALKRVAKVFLEFGHFMDHVLLATVRGHESFATSARLHVAHSEGQDSLAG